LKNSDFSIANGIKPFKSKENVSIIAKAIILLDDVTSTKGKVSLVAQEKYIQLGDLIHSRQKSEIKGNPCIKIKENTSVFAEYINSEIEEGISNKDGNKIAFAILGIADYILMRQSGNFEIEIDKVMDIVADLEFLNIATEKNPNVEKNKIGKQEQLENVIEEQEVKKEQLETFNALFLEQIQEKLLELEKSKKEIEQMVKIAKLSEHY